MAWQRFDDRPFDQIRPISFELDFTRFATSSVLAHCGNTMVLCTASIEPGVPKFLANSGQGWLTAEYRMLPSATTQRQPREFLKLSGRTQEIQRLIGRSLRASLNLHLLGERTITIDTDVLQADAGTRTTAITGGYVALALTIQRLLQEHEIPESPLVHPVAAISVGLLEGQALLDLDYQEDVAADIDFNVVMNSNLDIIELQGTAESGSFSRSQLNQMIDLAEKGIKEILELQQKVLS